MRESPEDLIPSEIPKMTCPVTLPERQTAFPGLPTRAITGDHISFPQKSETNSHRNSSVNRDLPRTLLVTVMLRQMHGEDPEIQGGLDLFGDNR